MARVAKMGTEVTLGRDLPEALELAPVSGPVGGAAGQAFRGLGRAVQDQQGNFFGMPVRATFIV